MTILGTITKKLPAKEFGTNGFQVSEIIIRTEETYPQLLPVQFTGNRSDLPDPCNVSDRVEISINLRGSEYTAPDGEVKYFSKIEGWKILKK